MMGYAIRIAGWGNYYLRGLEFNARLLFMPVGIGACIAAQKLGRQVNQDVWCISIDGNDVTLELIEKGQTTATLGVYPKMMGMIVIDQMAKVLNGQNVPYILETPSTVVDINNVVDYKSGKTWTEPVEGKPELDNGLPSGEFGN